MPPYVASDEELRCVAQAMVAAARASAAGAGRARGASP
jgi:hypothetical protein